MFVHLHTHTPYSFLDGGSEIEALVRAAAEMGHTALAMTDHDNVCGVVKFVAACEAFGLQPILGAEITLGPVSGVSTASSDGPDGNGDALRSDTHLTLLARNRAEYATICRILSAAHSEGGRLTPRLTWRSLFEALGLPDTHDIATSFGRSIPPCPLDSAVARPICLSGCRRGLVASLVRRHRYEEARSVALHLRHAFGDGSFFIELQDNLTPDASRICRELANLADAVGAPVVATNNVHHATRTDFAAHDILRCIATKTRLEDAHPLRPLNAERYLKSQQEMADLFAWRPDAIANTAAIARSCGPCLPRGDDITPRYAVPDGMTAQECLRRLTYRGARARYGDLAPHIADRLEHELAVICEMGYADYFLMVWDIVRWTRRQGIRCTGRGSAADSCVAYCLFLTDVDVIARNLPFARFLSPGRTPDIDMDFPSEHRDHVFRHIVEQYGTGHVGMVCIFFTFWARSAVRDVGKALELPEEAVDFLAKRLHHSIRADRIEAAFDRFAELKPHRGLMDRFRLLFALCGKIAGFPRHIGTHSSGIVISATPLDQIAPLQPSARGITEIWTLDKDDAEEVGAIKFDVLSLRALSAVGDAESGIVVRDPSFRYDSIPLDDRETYRMVRSGAAVGAFQFESAAQMSLAVTLDPRHFEDLVAAVALIRPGPIRGDVVRRFVGCRNGWACADWAHPCLKPILAKTYGCIVFQEQVNDVVAAMTGCSDADADRFRKSLKRHAKLNTLGEARAWFIEASLGRRPEMSHERLERLFDQIEGWSGYGFIEGHAAAFSLTGYKTAYLSVHHAAHYFAGLMNHQPMGFYSANTLAGEARRRGVVVLPIEINASGDKCLAVDAQTIRLGLRLVSGMGAQDIETVLRAREEGPFRSLLDFCSRAALPQDVIESLVLCGAFDLLHEHRRGILWRLGETLQTAISYRCSPTDQTALPLGGPQTLATPTAWDIADFSPWDKFTWTWRITGVCAECHAMAYMRDWLDARGVVRARDAQEMKPRKRIRVAGLNVRPHRPPTRSGEPVLFSQVEDETGLLQVTVAGAAIPTCTAGFLTSPAVVVEGLLQRRGRGAVLLAERVAPLVLRDATALPLQIMQSRGTASAEVEAPSREPAAVRAAA
jgi:error-prone DNA polymerase